MIDAIIGTDFVLSLGLALIHFLWQGAAIAIVTAALLAVCRRATARTRYNIACVGLLAMTLAPVLTVVDSLTGAAVAGATRLPSASALAIEGSVISADRSAIELAAWLPGIVAIWSIGVLLLTIRLARAWWATERVRRVGTHPVSQAMEAAVARLARDLGLRRRISLSESAMVDVPTVIGWIRPAILMPMGALAGLSVQQLEAVISHELAHIRRHDYLVNGLQNVAETLFFYHPGVWWISHQIRVEREHCCDDIAVSTCGNAVAYARALASLEEGRQHRAALALAATDGPLLTRVRRLLGTPTGDEYRPSLSIAAGIVAVMVAAAFSVAQARGTTQAPAPSANTPTSQVQESISVVGHPMPRGAVRLQQDEWDALIARYEALIAEKAAADRAAGLVPPPPPPPAAARPQTGGAVPDFPVAPPSLAPPPQEPLRVGGGIKEPRKITDVRPIYPEVAREAGVSGVVILEATIDAEGNVAAVRILRSIPLLDQAAIDSVRNWKYAPAMLNGAPVSVMMTVTVNFSLGSTLGANRVAPQTEGADRSAAERLEARIAAMEQFLREGQQFDNKVDAGDSSVPRVGGDIREPRKVRDARPEYPKIARAVGVSGVVILEATIDAQGNVADVRILRSIPMLDEAAVEAVRQWQYEPVMINGIATPVRMTLTVNFTLEN